MDSLPHPTLPWWLEWWWQHPLSAATAHPLSARFWWESTWAIVVALIVLVALVSRVVPWWRERRFVLKYRPEHARMSDDHEHIEQKLRAIRVHRQVHLASSAVGMLWALCTIFLSRQPITRWSLAVIASGVVWFGIYLFALTAVLEDRCPRCDNTFNWRRWWGRNPRKPHCLSCGLALRH